MKYHLLVARRANNERISFLVSEDSWQEAKRSPAMFECSGGAFGDGNRIYNCRKVGEVEIDMIEGESINLDEVYQSE